MERIDKRFKNRCFERRTSIENILVNIYSKDICLRNIESVEPYFQQLFKETSLFIYDYDLPNEGGYLYRNNCDLPILKDFSLVDVYAGNYIIDKKKNILVDRQPKGVKESFIYNTLGGCKFFDARNVFDLLVKIIEKQFKGFSYDGIVSDKVIKRFTKVCGNKWKVGLRLDYSTIKEELKNMYFPFPFLKLELIDVSVEKSYKPEEYFCYNEDVGMYIIGGVYVPNFYDYKRLGSNQDKEDYLLKKLYVLFKQYSCVLCGYIKFIEQIIENDFAPAGADL